MGKFVNELSTPFDLTMMSFEMAYGELVAMNPNSIKMAYLVCHPSNSFHATETLNAFMEGVGATANIAWSLRFVDFLDYDAWFITDGSHIVFSPGV